jgi:CRISPR/Cas system CMR-associated protein Cmr3 (group 5 of RAMP superfamily)
LKTSAEQGSILSKLFGSFVFHIPGRTFLPVVQDMKLSSQDAATNAVKKCSIFKLRPNNNN